MRADKHKQAADLLRQTVALLTDHAPADHQYVASAEHYLGEALLSEGTVTEAEHVLATAVERWKRSGAPPWRAARSESALGQVLHKLHRTREAEHHLVQSFRILMIDAGADEETKQTAKERLTRFYTDLGQRKKLEALLRESAEEPIAALQQ
jgi:hypothetical protein